jgi:predicted CXXCH cytochrome family protein
MQPATDRSMSRAVRGNFSGITITSASGPVRLSNKGDGAYFATMPGADGKSADFRILYTFGVYPLQEYLAATSRGRLQVLPVAWDTRARELGGQRWFSLYPNEHFVPGDPQYWTGRDQSWNFMCADCHSTDLHRNYDAISDTYRTMWSEINVACEACHGPASQHIESMRALGAQPRAPGSPDPGSRNLGLKIDLRASRSIQWGLWSPDQRIASPRGDIPTATRQSASCFPCHSRRRALTQAAAPGEALLDNYLPQLIESGVYHADGQIDAEDFEFGSFVQSKMYGKGVTCTNCHDAHSLKLRASGNALCTQCHRPDSYDRPTHHHHAADTAGSQCINCHMPGKTYMIVHSRRDHSFRVPRPDLTAALGIPNTCNQCHPDKKPTWAAGAIERWTGKKPDTGAHFANAIQDARGGANASEALLRNLSASPTGSGFVRSSLLSLLGVQAQPLPASALLERAAADPDPLVRLGVAHGLTALSTEDAIQVGSALLGDPTRAVRVEAARALAGVNIESLTPAVATRLQRAVDELIAVERASAERPESHVNLARIFERLGRETDAEQELNAALRLDPHFVPALVNLADLDRARGRENEAERWLREAMATAPLSAAPIHALGLLEVRRGQRDQALALLAKAVELDPTNARYAYVYAIALAESGQTKQAKVVVAGARRRLPKDAFLLELQRHLAPVNTRE